QFSPGRSDQVDLGFPQHLDIGVLLGQEKGRHLTQECPALVPVHLPRLLVQHLQEFCMLPARVIPAPRTIDDGPAAYSAAGTAETPGKCIPDRRADRGPAPGRSIGRLLYHNLATMMRKLGGNAAEEVQRCSY